MMFWLYRTGCAEPLKQASDASGFHCRNCTQAAVWRQTDVMTAGWDYYSWPGNSGPAASVGLVILWVEGCGIEFEELMGHSGKKSVGSWLS